MRTLIIVSLALLSISALAQINGGVSLPDSHPDMSAVIANPEVRAISSPATVYVETQAPPTIITNKDGSTTSVPQPPVYTKTITTWAYMTIPDGPVTVQGRSLYLTPLPNHPVRIVGKCQGGSAYISPPYTTPKTSYMDVWDGSLKADGTPASIRVYYKSTEYLFKVCKGQEVICDGTVRQAGRIDLTFIMILKTPGL